MEKEISTSYQTMYWKVEVENMMRIVNVSGESKVSSGRWIMEKISLWPYTITTLHWEGRIQSGFLKGRTASTQELPTTIMSTLKWKNSLYIKLKFIVSPLTMKDVNTTTIIDSGAQINCIDWAFIQWHRIPMKLLKHPFPIWNTDQTSNIICWYEATVYVQLENITQKVHFYVMNGGKENVILRHPWLEAVNPIINWRKGMVTIPPAKDKSLALSFSHLAKHASYLSKNTHPTNPSIVTQSA